MMSERVNDDVVRLFIYNDRVRDEFPEHHLARRFLLEFYDIQREVCGRDIEWPGRPRVEQEWNSRLLKRRFSFSRFAYSTLSYSVTMEEWFESRFSLHPSPAECERLSLYNLCCALLDECEDASLLNGNHKIVEFVTRIRSMLHLGIEVIALRLNTTLPALLSEWGSDAQIKADAWIATKS